MRKLVLIGLSTLFFAGSAPKVSANPAIPFGASICSTGVGCIVLGIVVIGGVAYHLIQKPDGSRMHVPILVDPEDPDGSMNVPENGGFFAESYAEAKRRCKSRGYRDAISQNYPSGGKYFTCIR